MDASVYPVPSVAAVRIGDEIHALAAEIYPICRSITGAGVRETLRLLGRHIDLEQHAVPTGTRVFDWRIPREWTIRDAFIRSADGRRVLDFKASNLHVVNYSMPIRRYISTVDLKRHVFTLPDQPDLIPYRTSYYEPDWGFCMSQRALDAMTDDTYEICIDSELADGHLTYGEYVHAGETEREFLLTAHICHPSLANDNCSGLALLTLLARNLVARRTRHTYRFLFAPGTIGSLAWLAANEERVPLVDHGLVVSCVGDAGGPTYKQSRRGNALIDRAMAHLVSHLPPNGKAIPFSPYGYDERQFCSPGFDMPVGLLQNSAFGTFPEYHTSADDLDFIRPEHLERSYRLIMDAIEIVETDRRPVNLLPKGEPQLGRRGLYSKLGGSGPGAAMPMLWVLNLSDGAHSLLDMAERSGLHYRLILDAADVLEAEGLLSSGE
ncbi:DUF4910 domain-containing protein [Mesorhizobium sp. CAU 1732]|uniref:DUF4910 domain-containing protein n=1 Tax=Mesorhizobium sp. CAU 1732 TaxID=3140358 RepID=UPI003261483C